MSLDIASIHAFFLAELNIKYPELCIFLEGQSKIAGNPARITYLLLNNGRNPRHSDAKEYSDPDSVPTTKYTDYVYDTYRYNIIVNEDVKNDAGKSYIKLVKEIAEDFFRFIKTDSFNFLMEPLKISYNLITGVQDGTISRLPFFEKRHFFDIKYGYNDIHERVEGSFIETFGIQRTNPI